MGLDLNYDGRWMELDLDYHGRWMELDLDLDLNLGQQILDFVAVVLDGCGTC